MLTPSMGVCGVPSTLFGSGSPAASTIVGARSITWVHCGRPAEAGQPSQRAADQLPFFRAWGGPVFGRLGLRRELRARGNHAYLGMGRECPLGDPVPTLIKFPLLLRDPLLRHLMRRVSGA